MTKKRIFLQKVPGVNGLTNTDLVLSLNDKKGTGEREPGNEAELTQFDHQVLRLKETTLADYSTSHVMNLISKDLDPIGQCIHMVPVLFTAPLELCIISLLLLVIIGWEALPGIAYMLVCMTLRCGVGRVYRKLRRNTAFFTDQRLRLLSEAISGIQAIKMNVWERAFENLFKNIRRFVLLFHWATCYGRCCYCYLYCYQNRYWE